MEQIITEFWARNYDDRRLSGRGDEEEFEDEDFDQAEVERLMADHPDDWEDWLDGPKEDDA
jgi:hypothetical protein